MHFELCDSLENIFSDSQVSQRPEQRLSIAVAHDGTVAVHLLATGLLEGGKVDLGLDMDHLPAGEHPLRISIACGKEVSDEPNAILANDYRLLAGWVRKLMPGVTIMDALMDESFTGAVDIWCPTVKTYQTKREVFDGYRAAGDRLWIYTCCTPGGPWINHLLYAELLRMNDPLAGGHILKRES